MITVLNALTIAKHVPNVAKMVKARITGAYVWENNFMILSTVEKINSLWEQFRR